MKVIQSHDKWNNFKLEVLNQINDKILIAKKCNVTILIEVGNGFTIIIICDEITSFSLKILSLGL
jgi:hypothetical protein